MRLPKFNRRSFFGAAAGAVAAGPMAVAAVAEEVKGRALNYGSLKTGAAYFDGSATVSGCTNPVEELFSLRKAIQELKRPPTRPNSVNRLDADLVASRSMSLSARLRIQAERNADRELADHKGWMQDRLNHLLGLPSPAPQ